MKKPCKGCPFSKETEPYLTPERGAELAYSTLNPYNTFPCHKTVSYDEDGEGYEVADLSKAIPCAGFLSMQSRYNPSMRLPLGFIPSDEVYEDAWTMAEAYQPLND
jgi:hypothetical protein